MPDNVDDDLNNTINKIIEITLEAGRVIMPYHKTKEVMKKFTIKDDRSPVTKADIAANDIIVKQLAKISDFPVLSEESPIPDFETRKSWDIYWLVDPLDGTKEFIAGQDNFTVNIALIKNHEPVLGVIALPTSKTCYYAHRGMVSHVMAGGRDPVPIHVAKWDEKRKINIVASRRHDNKDVDHIILRGVEADIARMGSSVKFCLIAEGAADLYPRFGPTSEWDTAAGQIIVEQAGGKVVGSDNNVLKYNTKESLLNPHFMVVGDHATLDRLWR